MYILMKPVNCKFYNIFHGMNIIFILFLEPTIHGFTNVNDTNAYHLYAVHTMAHDLIRKSNPALTILIQLKKPE